MIGARRRLIYSRSGKAGSAPPVTGNLRVRLDASIASSLILSGSSVNQWTDQVTAIPFTQATGSKKPALVNNVQSGLPVVRFDGVDDNLQCVTGLYAQPVSLVLVVSSIDNTILTGDANFYRDSSSGGVFYLNHAVGDQPSMFGGAGPIFLAAYTSAPTVYFNVWNGASSKLQGQTTATGDAGVNGINGATFYLGCGFNGASAFTKFDLCEFLVYNVALTAQNIIDLKAFFLWKWGIP